MFIGKILDKILKINPSSSEKYTTNDYSDFLSLHFSLTRMRESTEKRKLKVGIPPVYLSKLCEIIYGKRFSML